MSESTTTKRRTTPSIDSPPSTSIPANISPAIAEPSESEEEPTQLTPSEDKTVWVVSQRYGTAVAINGVYGSEEKLLAKYPHLREEGTLYRDCDLSGNGLTARKFIIN